MDHAVIHSGLEYILTRILEDFLQFVRKTGLSAPQIHALLYIYHSRDGECGLAEIGGLADSSRPATSQLVERLVQQGLVERMDDPRDRRQSRLRLTRKSIKLIESGIGAHHFLTDLMMTMPSNQRETVHTALGYLLQAGQRLEASHTREDEEHT